MSSYSPRELAVSVLSGHKMRMLEDVGLTVMDKRRAEALEKLWDGLHDKVNKCPRFDATACNEAIKTLIFLQKEGETDGGT